MVYFFPRVSPQWFKTDAFHVTWEKDTENLNIRKSACYALICGSKWKAINCLVNAGNLFKLFFTALYWHNALQYGSALLWCIHSKKIYFSFLFFLPPPDLRVKCRPWIWLYINYKIEQTFNIKNISLQILWSCYKSLTPPPHHHQFQVFSQWKSFPLILSYIFTFYSYYLMNSC